MTLKSVSDGRDSSSIDEGSIGNAGAGILISRRGEPPDAFFFLSETQIEGRGDTTGPPLLGVKWVRRTTARLFQRL
jgi:hypothetical protein